MIIFQYCTTYYGPYLALHYVTHINYIRSRYMYNKLRHFTDGYRKYGRMLIQKGGYNIQRLNISTNVYLILMH